MKRTIEIQGKAFKALPTIPPSKQICPSDLLELIIYMPI